VRQTGGTLKAKKLQTSWQNVETPYSGRDEYHELVERTHSGQPWTKISTGDLAASIKTSSNEFMHMEEGTLPGSNGIKGSGIRKTVELNQNVNVRK
jgi:hypothetical protein